MALEAAYSFDDTSSSTVVDHSGNGRNIALAGSAGVQVAGGRHGSALGKTGSAMPVLPSSVLAASQTDDRCLMFDAKNNFTTWWVRWEKDSIGSGTWGILYLSGVMQFFARQATGDSQMAGRPTTTPPGTTDFHNYAITYVRSTGIAKFYKDGISVGSASFPAGTQLVTNADRINLAEWSSTGAALDNLRIFSHAPSDAEIAALAGTPVTAPGVTGTLAATMPVFVAGLDGAISASGDIEASLLAMTAGLSGSALSVGELSADLPMFGAELSAEGSLSGTLQANLLAMEAGLASTAEVEGELSAVLPVLGAALLGTVETPDNFSALMPAFEAEMSGEVSGASALAGMLPAMQAGLLGTATGQGILSAEMPAMEAFLTDAGELILSGQVIITLPKLTMGKRRMFAVSLEDQRALTREFIASNPIFVALVPNVRTRKPSGGYDLVEGVPRPSQMLRLIPMSHTELPASSTSAAASSDSGVQRRYDYTLLGEWDAAMQVNDEWETEDGQRLVIENMVSYNGYERKGLVISYGRSPDHA